VRSPSLASKVFDRGLRPAYRAVLRAIIGLAGRVSLGLVYRIDQFAQDILAEVRSHPALAVSEVRFAVFGADFALDIEEAPANVRREYKELELNNSVYEPVMTRCLTHLLEQTTQPRFMDLGAFMGYYACYVATRLNDTAPVYAVESNPDYCRSIEHSFELNELRNAKVFNAVLSDREERVQIDGVTVRYGANDGTAATTLDSLCAEHGIAPNIVKMDVHGTEGKILFGMQDVLRNSVDHLLLELHPYHYIERYSAGITRADMLGLLHDLGFTIAYIAGHRIPNSEKSRPCIQSGGFAYRRVNGRSAEELLFDRQHEIFLLATRCDDLVELLGEPVFDPLLV
jgi:FkbM family methyltransferase